MINDRIDYQQWKNSEVTKMFMLRLKERRSYYEDALLRTSFSDLSVPSKYIGKINVLDEIINFSYEDLIGKDND